MNDRVESALPSEARLESIPQVDRASREASDRPGRDASADPAATIQPRLAWIVPAGPEHWYVMLNDGQSVHRLKLHTAALLDLEQQIADAQKGSRGCWPKVDASSGAKLNDRVDGQTGAKLNDRVDASSGADLPGQADADPSANSKTGAPESTGARAES